MGGVSDVDLGGICTGYRQTVVYSFLKRNWRDEQAKTVWALNIHRKSGMDRK